MSKQFKNFLTLAGLIGLGAFLAFLYNCIEGLAQFSGRINPAVEPWVFWILFGSVAAALIWMVGGTLFRPKPLLVHANPTEEELAAFRRQLLSRLKRNRVLRDEEVVVNSEEDMGAALAVLKEKADDEIRATARRVFIGTALSQNGRLDVLVVLYLVSRMSWRVAKLYDQRPHYRELINLYVNVAITAFVAGSIEDLGLEEHVTNVMAPLVSGSAIGAVPGAQAIAGTITNSVLTGSTNCLLALRCGIIARDFLSLNLEANGSMRKNATMEASRIFVSMSGETVVYVTKALVRGTTNAMKAGSTKTARKVSETVSGTAEAIGNGARKVGQGTRRTAESVGKGVRGAADAVAGGAKCAGKGIKDATDSVTCGVKNAADTVVGGAKKVGGQVKSTTKSVKDGVARTAESAKKATEKVVEEAKASGSGLRRKASTATGKGKSNVKNVFGKVDKAGETAKKRFSGFYEKLTNKAKGSRP